MPNENKRGACGVVIVANPAQTRQRRGDPGEQSFSDVIGHVTLYDNGQHTGLKFLFISVNSKTRYVT